MADFPIAKAFIYWHSQWLSYEKRNTGRYPYRTSPGICGKGLAATAAAVVIAGTAIVVAQQDQHNDEQNPSAVATERIAQTHSGNPPFSGINNSLCAGGKVVTASAPLPEKGEIFWLCVLGGVGRELLSAAAPYVQINVRLPAGIAFKPSAIGILPEGPFPAVG